MKLLQGSISVLKLRWEKSMKVRVLVPEGKYEYREKVRDSVLHLENI